MDFPIQLFEADGIGIPIELVRFYYITTGFFIKSVVLANTTLFAKSVVLANTTLLTKSVVLANTTLLTKSVVLANTTLLTKHVVILHVWDISLCFDLPNPLHYSGPIRGGSFQPTGYDFYY